MTKTNTTKTITRKAQARILQRHILAFVKAQMKATEALEAINAIALCENDGNPLPYALTGTGSVLSYARNGHSTEAEIESFDFLLTRSKQAIDASGYWASNI